MKIKRLFYLFPTAFAAFFLAGCTTPDYEKLAAEAAPQIPLTAEQKGYMLGPDDLTPQSTNGWTEAANSELGDFSEGLSQYICNLRDIDSITVYSEPYHHAMEASMLGPVLYQQVKVTKAQPLRDLMFKLKEQVPQCKSKSPFVWKLEANNQYSYDVVDDSKVPNSIVWKMTVKGNDDAGNEHQKLVYIAIMVKGEAMVALVLTGVDYTANDGIKPILDEAMAKVTAK
ncbi:hypothetical protein FYJ63_01730 [Mobiluncus holmesii]|uniref:Uncharacterized protein n=2 Tax=Mobiluncus porci TaxID=2652278 RepID=A0A7K0K0L6_9ACTO|nr:hypothetical protein [Mobiluncus porci]